ncbi:MAG: peptidylprolyl isomerase [Nostoc sp. DedVER02]|uniref:peptidylprolyl isomerase n=1 Tax=unclassified Nostoc TaxID=2593658 RepID=UPI002AD2516F|nr:MULTISPECIES: peptidylprolyl isomerase [unclassified Nostoc]MDZ7989053.1 peptidylprolyl isomerase [Nostoc sp. DedVER02]MDZ8111600.1 peptidylprolyl isomerase [Nostoc sp. DedVER01b]
MSKSINVSNEDILYQIKISAQFPGLVEAIACRKIITDTAEKVGIQLELEELQQAADNLRLTNKLLKAEDTWAWLEKHHLSLDEFEALAYTNQLSNKLATHLFAEQVEPFFYKHQLDYAGAVTYEVILDDEDLALELFCALKEDEISFQEVARQYIEEPEIRRAGGYRGIQRRQDFRPEIAAAVFAATPPQILKPIITPKGVHIILVEEIIEAKLNEQLRVQILADLFGVWLKQQIAELEIVTQLNCDRTQVALP